MIDIHFENDAKSGINNSVINSPFNATELLTSSATARLYKVDDKVDAQSGPNLIPLILTDSNSQSNQKSPPHNFGADTPYVDMTPKQLPPHNFSQARSNFDQTASQLPSNNSSQDRPYYDRTPATSEPTNGHTGVLESIALPAALVAALGAMARGKGSMRIVEDMIVDGAVGGVKLGVKAALRYPKTAIIAGGLLYGAHKLGLDADLF